MLLTEPWKGADAEPPERKNLSISWEIFELLAVFISLAVMGWFHLLTKRFIMPSCDEIEAKDSWILGELK